MDIEFSIAEPEQADTIAEIITKTSGGIVDYLLDGLAPGYSPAELLSSVVVSEDNAYSYRNAVLAMKGHDPAGLILAYPWDQHSLPRAARNFFLKKRLKRLEHIVNSLKIESMYINTIWVRSDLRGSGLADAFMDIASSMAIDQNLTRLSLHVWADNQRAIRFYRRHGFSRKGHFPVKPHPLLPHEGGKLLMVKELGG